MPFAATLGLSYSAYVALATSLTVRIAVGLTNAVSTVEFIGEVAISEIRPVVLIKTLCSLESLLRDIENKLCLTWITHPFKVIRSTGPRPVV